MNNALIIDDENNMVLISAILQKSGYKTLVIAMTSDAMSGYRKRLLEAGCNGYIEKPIDPARVIAQIQAFTGRNP